MTSKVCSVPGCPVISDKPMCPAHRRAAEQARGTRKDRGYDAAHIREGNAWRGAGGMGRLPGAGPKTTAQFSQNAPLSALCPQSILPVLGDG